MDGEEVTENGASTTTQKGSGLPWEASDRDYTYEELLGMLSGRGSACSHRLGMSVSLASLQGVL